MHIKKFKTSLASIAGSISLGLLGFLIIALLLPYASQTVDAASDCLPNEAPCTTSQAHSKVKVEVASSISVALDATVDIAITPTNSNNNFVAEAAKLIVSTNNPSGYAIYMEAARSIDGKAALFNANSNINTTIDPVNSTVTGANFAANTWGYSLDNTTYQAVPVESSLIKETSTTALQDTYDLSFGVAADTTLPAGTYTNSVIVSALANPIEISNLSQLVYMQDMTPEICARTELDPDNPVTKQLIDTRDGKKYWVSKLRDGNCWMVQNLALDIDAEKGLSASDTDIAEDWNKSSAYPPASTEMAIPTATGQAGNDDALLVGTYSWDLGNIKSASGEAWVFATPRLGLDCSNLPTGSSLATCEKVGLVKIDQTWTDDFDAATEGQNRTFVFQNDTAAPAGTPFDGTLSEDRKTYTGYVTVDVKNKRYDAHYLLGNYYQWGTATASSGNMLSGTTAPHSICPKGWQLPLGNTETAGSFYNVLQSYGMTTSFASVANTNLTIVLPGTQGTAAYSTAENQFSRLNSPYYAFALGTIARNAGTLNSLGTTGSHWAGTAFGSKQYAFTAGFNFSTGQAGDGNAHNGASRWTAHGVRCLVHTN